MVFCPKTPKEESQNCPNLDSRNFAKAYIFVQTSDWDEIKSKLVALDESFPTMCRTPPACTGVKSILDF
jgi:hypothetical protein